jgi:hypothetical protein
VNYKRHKRSVVLTVTVLEFESVTSAHYSISKVVACMLTEAVDVSAISTKFHKNRTIGSKVTKVNAQ